MELKIVKGKDIETQIKSIDAILHSVLGQVRGKASQAFVSKCGVSGYVEQALAGVDYLHSMFPLDGMIKKVAIVIDDVPKDTGLDKGKPKAGISIYIEDNPPMWTTKSIELEVGKHELNVDVPIKFGTRMKVSVNRLVVGLWIALLVEPKLTPVVVELVELKVKEISE